MPQGIVVVVMVVCLVGGGCIDWQDRWEAGGERRVVLEVG